MNSSRLFLILLFLSPALFVTFYPADAVAATEKVLYAFQGPDGSVPEGGVILDATGNLYGTTYFGGAPGACFNQSGCGTIFELAPQPGGSWTETVLYSFDLNHGAYPDQNLIFDPAGNLYGVTAVGGNVGDAFELAKTPGGWSYNVIHAFHKGDGSSPESRLLLDGAANLYGTTAGGGNANGVVYELTPVGGKWQESVLLKFKSGNSPPDGAAPQAGLIQDSAGNLFGTTGGGGNPGCPAGCGTIFELSPNGDGTWTHTVLHKFSGTDGMMPVADLVADASGNLFGTATEGGSGAGCFAGCGTLFELAKTPSSWNFTVLYVFKNATGGSPETRLVLDGSGSLYGTAIIGGLRSACPVQHGCGVVFKLSPVKKGGWKYSVVYKFQNGADGALPAGVVFDQAGNLYGTTRWGGTYGQGTVFEVTP